MDLRNVDSTNKLFQNVCVCGSNGVIDTANTKTTTKVNSRAWTTNKKNVHSFRRIRTKTKLREQVGNWSSARIAQH